MSPSPEPTRREFDDLWRALVGTARRQHVPAGLDAEDLAAEAILRLVKDPAPASPVPIAQRGRRKLKDARAEIYRHRERRNEPVQIESIDRARDREEAGEPLHPGRDDDRYALAEALTTIRQTLDDDVETYARCRMYNMTLEEIAALPGWNPRRVDRARKALKRATEPLVNLLIGPEPNPTD